MSDEYAQVAEFRNRFVDYVNQVLQYNGRYSGPPDAKTQLHLQGEQAWLMRAFGRLNKPLHRYGTASMTNAMFGVVSQDVIRDAIAGGGGAWRGEMINMAVHHLDVVLGQLEADAVSPERSPTRTGREPAGSRRTTWLSKFGVRITAVGVGAVLLGIVYAVVSGWASAFFTQHPFP
jgi:hypothetical protein